jgi:hypothetical protein
MTTAPETTNDAPPADTPPEPVAELIRHFGGTAEE